MVIGFLENRDRLFGKECWCSKYMSYMDTTEELFDSMLNTH